MHRYFYKISILLILYDILLIFLNYGDLGLSLNCFVFNADTENDVENKLLNLSHLQWHQSYLPKLILCKDT